METKDKRNKRIGIKAEDNMGTKTHDKKKDRIKN